MGLSRERTASNGHPHHIRHFPKRVGHVAAADELGVALKKPQAEVDARE
jgi:hypothetical protein